MSFFIAGADQAAAPGQRATVWCCAGHVVGMSRTSGPTAVNEDQDDELGRTLRRSAPAVSEQAVKAAQLVARQARGVSAGARPLSRRRPRWQAAAAVGVGVVLLAGAGSVTAYQLGVPPFQTLEEGVGRAHDGVPVVYENSLGRTVECTAFIEYRDLDADQRAAVDDVAADPRWQGYGQRVLDDLDIPRASPEAQNTAVLDVVGEDLWVAAREAVPGLSRDLQASGPRFAGWSASCAGPGGVDGRP